MPSHHQILQNASQADLISSRNAVMRLNMAEREPQNKQNVSKGSMRGLISRSSYQKCSDTTRQIDMKLAS